MPQPKTPAGETTFINVRAKPDNFNLGVNNR